MTRTEELREEAADFERAAAFLLASAARKRRLAVEIERIGGAGKAHGWGDADASLPRRAGTRGDDA